MLNDDERDAVDALVEYRLRLADKPFLKPMALTPQLKQLSDSVLSKEHSLLSVLAENVEEELTDLLTEKEASNLALTRHKEMCALLEGGLARAAALRNSLLELKRGKDQRKAVAANTSAAHAAAIRAAELENRLHHAKFRQQRTTAAAAAVGGGGVVSSGSPSSTSRSTAGAGGGGGATAGAGAGLNDSTQDHESATAVASTSIHEDITTKSLADIERQVQIESALSANLERTMTVLYPTYLDFIGRIAMMRRRCNLEKEWSVTTAQELEVVESKMKTLKVQDTHRKLQLQQARQALDDANRAMFMSRKELTTTHHRVLGLEKLKNGVVIDAQSSIDLVNKIRQELQQRGGESETFNRLMESECVELCDLASAPTVSKRSAVVSGGAGGFNYYNQTPATAAAANSQPQMGATPFVIGTSGRATARR